MLTAQAPFREPIQHVVRFSGDVSLGNERAFGMGVLGAYALRLCERVGGDPLVLTSAVELAPASRFQRDCSSVWRSASAVS